jgi:hypothetical protein
VNEIWNRFVSWTKRLWRFICAWAVLMIFLMIFHYLLMPEDCRLIMEGAIHFSSPLAGQFALACVETALTLAAITKCVIRLSEAHRDLFGK